MQLTSKKENFYKVDKTQSYWVYREDGSRFMDISSGAFAYILGYGNQEIVDEISSTLSNTTRVHVPTGQTTDDVVEMTELMLSTGNWKNLIWSMTGTGAVEAGVHIAKNYHRLLGNKREKVISFGLGWHGTSEVTKLYSGIWPSDYSIPTPVWLTEEERDEQEDGVLTVLAGMLAKEPDIGQILINPNPWFNGVNVWSENFWKQLDKIRDEFGILIITDDVASCWGKGKTYHTYKTVMPEGMQPDISCLGKAITAGYAPLSAAVANEKVASVVQGKVAYAHTFQPYVGGIAAMKATNRIIERDDLFAKADWIETECLRIGNLLKQKEKVVDVKAFGTCAAFYTRNKEDGSDLKSVHYGLSSDMSSKPNLRICVPLIADENYFQELEHLLLKNL